MIRLDKIDLDNPAEGHVAGQCGEAGAEACTSQDEAEEHSVGSGAQDDWQGERAKRRRLWDHLPRRWPETCASLRFPFLRSVLQRIRDYDLFEKPQSPRLGEKTIMRFTKRRALAKSLAKEIRHETRDVLRWSSISYCLEIATCVCGSWWP